jgi:hypothetical protein
MSMEESCLMDPPVHPEITHTAFPCYRFDNEKFNGTSITSGCGLKWNCKKVENITIVEKEKMFVQNPADFPMVVVVGVTFAVMLAMLE